MEVDAKRGPRLPVVIKVTLQDESRRPGRRRTLSISRRQDPADPLCLGDVKPGKALFGKVLLFRRLKLGGLIKRTDMKMRFRRPWESFAGQS
jgi:hypothetical protein